MGTTNGQAQACLAHGVSPAVRLYVGGDAQNVQRRRLNLTGYRMFSGAYGPKSRFRPDEVPHITGILDSGAFSDVGKPRLSPEGALERQLTWEREAERFWGHPWRAEALVSYDQLVDEKVVAGKKRKVRWSVTEAEVAVRTTIAAAEYLASQRARLAPRHLVLSCQGVDAHQYEECLRRVLAVATSADWIGLGGWCILGQRKNWLPVFWQAMRVCLPLVAQAGIRRIHLFGVLWPVALGGLLWLADQYGLVVSTDSGSPVLSVLWKDKYKAGAHKETWEENVAWHVGRCAALRSTEHYREPARKLLTLW